jgi:hypothetical protein
MSPGTVWPDGLFDLVFIPSLDNRLEELAAMAEPEEWHYHHTAPTEHQHPAREPLSKHLHRGTPSRTFAERFSG